MMLRAATAGDAAAISAIHRLAAFRTPSQTDAESLRFVREWLLAANRTWVAVVEDEVVGYVTWDDAWLRHLFVHPDHQRRGYGATLLAHVMADRRERQLWTFAGNVRARRFYEDRGWMLVELTDGAGNGEGEPEVRYLWRPE